MPPPSQVLLGAALLGLLVAVGALLWLRVIGADLRTARRLAGARQLTVAEALDLAASPGRPVRLSGRIRCTEPLVTEDGEGLVAYHRDVEVRLPGGRWRVVE